MKEDLHDLIHALVMVEKYHNEEQRWLEIVNKLINKMALNDESTHTDTLKPPV